MIENERMKEVLREFGKTHNEKELVLACAKWTADIVDQFEFKPLPSKTIDVRNFEEIPEEDRLCFTPEYYNSKPHIMQFYNLYRRVRDENRAIYDWLKECKITLLENGLKDEASKLDLKLKDVTVEQLR